MESVHGANLLKITPEIKAIPKEEIDIQFTEPLSIGYGTIHAPETTQEQAEINSENMKQFFVEVALGTPSDCIDGRCSTGLMNGEEIVAPRPTVAGGAGMTGYAAAELVDYFGLSKDSIGEKFEQIVERLENVSGNAPVVAVGGHVDEDAVRAHFTEGKTGCGAADKFLANLALLGTTHVTYEHNGQLHTETDEELERRVNAVKTLAKVVSTNAGYLDASVVPVDEYIDDVMARATALVQHAQLDGWNGGIMKDSVQKKGQDRVNVLSTKDGGVHGHTERKALFVYINNVTLDQEAYYKATRSEENNGLGREVFDIDVWHIRDIANKLAAGPDETQADRIFVAGVAFQIATYLGLCDGSHRAFFALPQAP